MIRIIFLLAGFCFLSSAIFASEFKDQKGRVYQGDILDQDAENIFLETASGLISLKKSDLAEKDGEPYAGASDVKQAPAVLAPAPVQAEGHSPDSPYAVKVGSSGLTDRELSVYLRGLSVLERHKQLSGLDWGTPNVEIRKAIEDEIAFQEALKAGLHREPEFRKAIAGLYQANQTLGDIHPQLFQKDEMKAYYQKHLKEFMKPAQYLFKVLSGPKGSGVDLQKAKSRPASVTGWKQGRWMKEGDSFYLPLTKAQITEIYRLRKNQVALIDDTLNGSYAFWCTDYQPPVQKSFEEAEARVKHLMIQDKKSGNLKGLKQKLSPRGSGKEFTEAAFEEALKQNYHRDRSLRDKLINGYLQRKGITLGDLARSVKNQYPVMLTKKV